MFLYKGSATGFVLWKIITPSDAQAGQRFGQSLAAGDFDGDGVQELAVGAPRAMVNGKAAAGKVYLYRINGGRDVDETEVIVKPATGGAVEVLDRFGHALAAGLFFEEDDPSFFGRRHLAIGAPGARNGAQGRVGRVWVLNTQAEPRFREVRVRETARRNSVSSAMRLTQWSTGRLPKFPRAIGW